MPCHVDCCVRCGSDVCRGGSDCDARRKRNVLAEAAKYVAAAPLKSSAAGYLCDILRLIEKENPVLLEKVDANILKWWIIHRKKEDNE